MLGLLLTSTNAVAEKNIIQSATHEFKMTVVTKGLKFPWGLAFLPNGKILITEKTGQLRIIEDGKLLDEPVKGLPDIKRHGQGGLLDIVIHPDFEKNHWVYFSYAGKGKGGHGTEIARAVFKDNQLSDVKVLFSLDQKSNAGVHFGSRLVFDKNNYLYFTIGDRGNRNRAQDLSDPAGSVLRIKDDGSTPKDNPFINKKDAIPEIFAYGNRNPQGIAIQPSSELIWASEFAPQGGDEINIIKAGTNYGWPVITYGEEYGGGKIGQTHKEGMAQPVKYWVPSINPSGISFYNGNQFPKWQGDLFIASLNGLIIRLDIEGEKVLSEEHLLKHKFGRIRHVKEGPDGFIYFLTDDFNGQLIRLEPIEK